MAQQQGRQGQKQEKQAEQQGQSNPTVSRSEEHGEVVQEILGSRAGSQQVRSALQQTEIGGLTQPQTLHPLLQSVSPVSPRVQAKPLFGGVSADWSGAASTGLVIQPKLMVGAAGDQYEQEADRVAAAVEQMHSPAVTSVKDGQAVQRMEVENADDLRMKPISFVQREEMEGETERVRTKRQTSVNDLRAGMQVQRNETGIPNNLKAGVEALSNISLDNVKVQYNSSKPAKLNALAYAQGTEIHVAPGQERHLPHEIWHVVQQAQGRVRPNRTTAGVAVCDNPDLEQEADQMGFRATARASANSQDPNGLSETATQGEQEEKSERVSRGDTTVATSTVVQMAGQGDYVNLSSGYGIKAPGEKEMEQYERGEIPPTAPKLIAVAKGGSEELRKKIIETKTNVTPEELEKIWALVEKHPHGPFIIITSATAGLDRVNSVDDVKLGTHTALESDQKPRSEKFEEKLPWIIRGYFKMKKVEKDDTQSGSREFGYRPEEDFKKHRKAGGGVASEKAAEGRAALKERLKGAGLQGLWDIKSDLTDLSKWVSGSSVVYVAMSVLLVVGHDADGQIGKAVPIDFEHPITEEKNGAGDFKIARDGLLLGINNLISMVDSLIDDADGSAMGDRIDMAMGEEDEKSGEFVVGSPFITRTLSKQSGA